ncbi:lipoprotein-releasing ABC transporter permease subunit [Roseospirillum parvum]|uniref:Lipoprotein-releasing system permease protein n=1 Tax=Roseospirillum parvum TaxID=83401 RepID=A0A1G7Y160_9PROT|nr:lipoprotein-releasing ABC transporter permease subunit [Roseospirillum parvum]SDG90198.1 lipoprotein-releasing system permease protein [Roseospirillum parvum]
MFGPFERMMALRYLRARRKEGFVSVIAGFSLLGIGLGVATLIIVMSVMNGFRQDMLGRILGLNGHINVPGPIADYDPLRQRIAEIDGVKLVIPAIQRQVMATGGGEATGALVHGMAVEDMAARDLIADNIVAGSLEHLKADPESVLIGQRLARKLRLGIDSPITLISPKGTVTAFGTVPRMKAYRVGAIFNVGMYEYDSSFIYLPLDSARTYFRFAPDTVGHLEVVSDNPMHIERLAEAIAQVAGQRVFTWKDSNFSFFNALKVERNVMFLILTLIILVAAFNIISGLIMLVKDKGRDIAILRTMGAGRGAVMRIFFLAGASVGLIGTAFGVTLGLLFCNNIEAIRQFLQSVTGAELFSAEIYFLSRMPAEVDPAEVVMVVGMSLGLSLLATLYPAWRAARLDPVEALRYE